LINLGIFGSTKLATNNYIGEIAATETNNGVGIDWGNTYFSLYPWWIGSVAEAVFLLGAERNADKVIGTTYVSSPNPVS
jgi:hypothetical protein